MKIKEACAHHQSTPNASVNVSNISSFLSLLFTRKSEVGALKLEVEQEHKTVAGKEGVNSQGKGEKKR